MSSKRRRKPRKIYKTVIRLTPEKDSSKRSSGPKIDIQTETIRPKLIPQKPVRRGKLRRTILSAIEKDTKSKFKLVKRYDEGLIQEREWVPVTKNTRWKCIRCGWCCSHDWRVNLTWTEYDRLKNKLPIDEVVVDESTALSHPLFTIKGHCAQYDPKTKKCKIYKQRAYSCATFPFSLTPDGELVRSKYCKGFGKGERVNRKNTIGHIMKWRKKAGMKI